MRRWSELHFQWSLGLTNNMLLKIRFETSFFFSGLDFYCACTWVRESLSWLSAAVKLSAEMKGIYLPILEPLKWVLSPLTEEKTRKCWNCLCEGISLEWTVLKTLLKELWIYRPNQQRDAQLEERHEQGVETRLLQPLSQSPLPVRGGLAGVRDAWPRTNHHQAPERVTVCFRTALLSTVKTSCFTVTSSSCHAWTLLLGHSLFLWFTFPFCCKAALCCPKWQWEVTANVAAL